MTRIELAPGVMDDLDRFFEHLESFEVENLPERVGEIIDGLQILARHPLIGRSVKSGKRELVMGQATKGYVALYRYAQRIDTVFVLAIRSQRESGYSPRQGS